MKNRHLNLSKHLNRNSIQLNNWPVISCLAPLFKGLFWEMAVRRVHNDKDGLLIWSEMCGGGVLQSLFLPSPKVLESLFLTAE